MAQTSAQVEVTGGFATNEWFIDGIHRPLKVPPAIESFAMVFAQLAGEVYVFPTENYYYFELIHQGRRLKGNIALPVDTRQNGKLTFALEEVGYVTDPNQKPLAESEFSETDGVVVKEITPFKYSVAFGGKTVIFNLNKLEQRLGKNASLIEDEVFVARNFDESGVGFTLIFNKKENHFLWLLDEGGIPSEEYAKVNKEILIGKRTGFAFYEDTANHRKILIGVDAAAQDGNTWYDGPFDQLPDNHILSGEVKLQEYIELARPDMKGKINQYGVYLDDEGSRVAIAPYIAYKTRNDLIRLVYEAKEEAKEDRSVFYCELTPMY